MVLARRHIRRLWYPEPGAGGAIPSRAEHALSNAEFNRRMPTEFWREVVDRVAAEAPGTLLLAEAFWLLEGYFVRTLGMHRVYNSAFMHMLRDEDNAGYRKVMRDTLEFDPGVLGRFVNFLTNPDERPAAEQFGTGDKAFSAATLLATLPGPADARPRPGRGLPRALRHGVPAGPLGRAGRRGARRPLRVGDRAAAPAPRARSPGTDRFRLYDALDDDGRVDENVYAYSNGARRAIAASCSSTTATPRRRSASTIGRRGRRPGGGGGRSRASASPRRSSSRPRSDDALVRFVDPRSGWELTRTAGELRREGLRVSLGPYEARVLGIARPGASSPSRAPVHAVASRRRRRRDAAGRGRAPREAPPREPAGPPRLARAGGPRRAAERPPTKRGT